VVVLILSPCLFLVPLISLTPILCLGTLVPNGTSDVRLPPLLFSRTDVCWLADWFVVIFVCCWFLVVWYVVLTDALGFSDPLYPVLLVCSVMCFCSGTDAGMS
jgi:hypothetical protein